MSFDYETFTIDGRRLRPLQVGEVVQAGDFAVTADGLALVTPRHSLWNDLTVRSMGLFCRWVEPDTKGPKEITFTKAQLITEFAAMFCAGQLSALKEVRQRLRTEAGRYFVEHLDAGANVLRLESVYYDGQIETLEESAAEFDDDISDDLLRIEEYVKTHFEVAELAEVRRTDAESKSTPHPKTIFEKDYLEVG